MDLLSAVVRSLSFREDRSALLGDVPANRWPQLLTHTDAAHISLALATRCLHAVPEPARNRLEASLARNVARHARVVEAHVELAQVLNSRGIEFVVLKGLTHTGFWNSDSRYRPQYDADIFVQPDSIAAATEAIKSLGYEACQAELRGSDHLPTMLRRSGWRWRGDFFDPDQPLALELHFRFWNPALGFAPQGADGFWNRRTTVVPGGVTLPALHPVDKLRYASWHAVRHLLRGTLKILHVYELAHFLHHSAEEHSFWQEWRGEGAPADRVTELIAFRLAATWFECRMNPIAGEYVSQMPADVNRWFDLFAFSPIAAITRPNKDELFLHLCLAQAGGSRRGVATRRLLPRRLPTFILDAHDTKVDLRLRLRRGAGRAAFIAQRLVHHARTIPALAGSGFRWWLPR